MFASVVQYYGVEVSEVLQNMTAFKALNAIFKNFGLFLAIASHD